VVFKTGRAAVRYNSAILEPASQVLQGSTVPLSLNTRGVGKVTIVRCSGRIAAGETEALHLHVNELLCDRVDIALHLGEVAFIDSSGLGMLVRLLTSTRRAGGDLKLCQLPEIVHKVLKMTSLITLFDTYESEEDAILSFYRRQAVPARTAPAGLTVLCVDQSADVLAYLRELLVRAGYNVLTNNNLRDSLILLRATRPGLTILGPNLTASPATEQAFRSASAASPLLELGEEFSTQEAGQAASGLMEKIRALSNPAPP
jgi:anti-sigma B factor antagonist